MLQQQINALQAQIFNKNMYSMPNYQYSFPGQNINPVPVSLMQQPTYSSTEFPTNEYSKVEEVEEVEKSPVEIEIKDASPINVAFKAIDQLKKPTMCTIGVNTSFIFPSNQGFNSRVKRTTAETNTSFLVNNC
jgi:hypothetical protein